MDKKLYRSRKNKIVAGVAGGIAEYFDIDPVFVRIGFVLLTVFHGAGLIIYITCAIIVPKEEMLYPMPDSTQAVEQTAVVKPEGSRLNWLGIILVIIGGLLLIDNLIPTLSFDVIFPAILVLFGGWLIISSSRNVKKEELQ
ncbi:MAG: PspC domain-containing protein [Ignavibacteriaceae bacterium]|nr:PspC domain-containing protein [Ignavibacteriaceae bacterium]